MKKWKLRTKIQLLAVTVGLLTVLVSPKPARAFIDDLMGILDTFEEYFPQISIVSDWVEIINSAISDPCSSGDILMIVPVEPGWCTAVTDAIGGDFTAIITAATGSLGIPNPLEVQQQIGLEAFTGKSDNPFIDNPIVEVSYEKNRGDRKLTKLNLESVMGNQGQKTRDDAIAEVGNQVKQIMSEADNAQTLTSSQDVLKSLVSIQAMDTAISEFYRQEQYLSRVDQQFTNLNLTNISRTLDEQSKREILGIKGNAAKALALSAQLSLY